MCMKSNYDRSKTIIRIYKKKTNKNHHPHADDLLLLIICRKKESESHRLAVY